MMDDNRFGFIPDVRFQASLRATLAGSARGGTETTGLMSVSKNGDVVTVWTWSRDGGSFSGQRIATEARRVAGKGYRIERRSFDRWFADEGELGVASRTVYRTLPK